MNCRWANQIDTNWFNANEISIKTGYNSQTSSDRWRSWFLMEDLRLRPLDDFIRALLRKPLIRFIFKFKAFFHLFVGWLSIRPFSHVKWGNCDPISAKNSHECLPTRNKNSRPKRFFGLKIGLWQSRLGPQFPNQFSRQSSVSIEGVSHEIESNFSLTPNCQKTDKQLSVNQMPIVSACGLAFSPVVVVYFSGFQVKL